MRTTRSVPITDSIKFTLFRVSIYLLLDNFIRNDLIYKEKTAIFDFWYDDLESYDDIDLV